MAAYATGDENAFARLFASLAPKMYGFFLRSFRDPSTCDELLQTTFLRIHRARTSYRPELAVRPWAFTIAAHVRRDELRRRPLLANRLADKRFAPIRGGRARGSGIWRGELGAHRSRRLYA